MAGGEQGRPAFCEALLSRFAIEVGRQLGDLEQQAARGDLQDAVCAS